MTSMFEAGKTEEVITEETLRDLYPSPAAPKDPVMALFSTVGDVDTLTYPGGLMEDLIDWVVSSSDRPHRWLTMGAVVAVLGAVIGRRFESKTGLRTAFYCLGLAPSGSGKGHARSQLKRLIRAVDVLNRLLGPARIMSASGLRSHLMGVPSCVSFIDEFDGLMRQINDPRAGIHNSMIAADLRDLWSEAGGAFDGAAYAAAKAVTLHNPNYCIYGTATPAAFWKAMGTLNTADGLLPRFMLFEGGDAKPPRVTPQADFQIIPATIGESFLGLHQAGRGTGNLAHIESGEMAFNANVVGYDAEAEAELRTFEAAIDAIENKAPFLVRPIINRAAGRAIKLALVATVAADWTAPVITGAHMAWAVKVAKHCTGRMITQTEEHVADNPRQAAYQKIRGMVRKAGYDGVTSGDIVKSLTNIDRNMRRQLIDDLRDAGEIVWEERKPPRGGRPMSRWFMTGLKAQ